MSNEGFPSYAHQRLVEDKSLSLDVGNSGGPMGSGSWRLTNGVVDVEVYSDRGTLGTAAGKHGGAALGCAVWGRVLDVQVNSGMTFEEQVDFFADHLEMITRIVENEPEIESKLRDISWTAVKDQLGLNPTAQRESPETWRS